MDLRSFDVPKNIDEIIREHEARKLVWYQPFIFSDTAITGTGAAWNNKIGIRQYMCTNADSQAVRDVFLEQNLKLDRWYKELVQMAITCSPESNEFLDLGCNVGHFSFEVTKADKKATGVDVWLPCYELVSEVTGLSFEYLNERYDSFSHTVPSLKGRKFDFIFASAIQTHLTDPHFFMGYTDQMARHGMLFTTPVITGNEPMLRLRVTVGRKERPVPERFEFLPTTSAMEFILQCMRPYVYRRAYQPGDPGNTRAWGVWIALSHKLSDELMNRCHLTLTQDRIDQFSDSAQGSFSIPKVKLGEKSLFSRLRSKDT